MGIPPYRTNFGKVAGSLINVLAQPRNPPKDPFVRFVSFVIKLIFILTTKNTKSTKDQLVNGIFRTAFWFMGNLEQEKVKGKRKEWGIEVNLKIGERVRSTSMGHLFLLYNLRTARLLTALPGLRQLRFAKGRS